MSKDTLYRLAVIVLLASILFVQFKILSRTPKPQPPIQQLTLGDVYGFGLAKNTPDEIQKQLHRAPVVHVMGSVSIDGEPITVEVRNEPLEVQVVR